MICSMNSGCLVRKSPWLHGRKSTPTPQIFRYRQSIDLIDLQLSDPVIQLSLVFMYDIYIWSCWERGIRYVGDETSQQLMSSRAFIQLITLSLPTHSSGNAVLSLNQHNSAVQILLFPTVCALPRYYRVSYNSGGYKVMRHTVYLDYCLALTWIPCCIPCSDPLLWLTIIIVLKNM